MECAASAKRRGRSFASDFRKENEAFDDDARRSSPSTEGAVAARVGRNARTWHFRSQNPNGIVLAPRLAARRDALGARELDDAASVEEDVTIHVSEFRSCQRPTPRSIARRHGAREPRVHAPTDPHATDEVFGCVSWVRARRSEADVVFGRTSVKKIALSQDEILEHRSSWSSVSEK